MSHEVLYLLFPQMIIIQEHGFFAVNYPIVAFTGQCFYEFMRRPAENEARHSSSQVWRRSPVFASLVSTE